MTTNKLKNPMVDELFQAVLQLHDEDECYQFFEDLCTVAEIRALAQRLQVAKMLRYQRRYSEIVATTGASTATISRVKRALEYGANGYQVILERLEAPQSRD